MVERHQRADAVRNRARILEAARARFAAAGPDVGMEDIARHAGVAVGTLYRHFNAKDDLATAVLEEFLATVADVAEAAASRVQQGADPGTELALFLDRSLTAASRNRAAKIAARIEAAPESERARFEARAGVAVAALLRSGQESGRIVTGVGPKDLALLTDGFPAEASEQARRRWLDIVLHGLLRDPALS